MDDYNQPRGAMVSLPIEDYDKLKAEANLVDALREDSVRFYDFVQAIYKLWPEKSDREGFSLAHEKVKKAQGAGPEALAKALIDELWDLRRLANVEKAGRMERDIMEALGWGENEQSRVDSFWTTGGPNPIAYAIKSLRENSIRAFEVKNILERLRSA